MKLSEIGDEILLKNEKIKFCEKKFHFSMTKSIELDFLKIFGSTLSL